MEDRDKRYGDMKRIVTRTFPVLLFGFSVSQIIFNLWQKLVKEDLIDFTVYWRAINDFLSGREIYKMAPDQIPFNYPPSASFILLPFKIFSLKTAEILLIILSFLSLWLSLWLVLKVSKIKMPRWLFLIFLAFFNQTFPVKFTLVLGQVNLLVLALAITGLFLWQKKKSFWSIFLFSLSCGLKIFPLAVLPLFLLAGIFGLLLEL